MPQFRNWLRAFQGPEVGDRLVCAESVQGQPPDRPNIFTDGAMTFPAENEMSTCGVGVWIPADTATVEQIAPGAYDYYHHR
eukprot:5238349-Alexandrium_andersonii.AAC.1